MAKHTKHRRTKGLGTLQLEKNGTYTLRAVINGKRISKATGKTNKEEAEAFLKEFMRPFVGNDKERMYDTVQALIESEDRRLEREKEKQPQMAFADAWEVYIKSPERRDLAEATLEGKKVVWNHWVTWMDRKFHHVRELRHVTAEMVELYLSELRVDHAASTYNNRVCVLREMYRVLSKKALVKDDPWKDVRLREDDSHSRRELTIEELRRLAVCAAKEGDEWRRLFGIGIYTGLRLGDCCRLNWKDIDIIRGIIQLIPSKTKKHAHGRPVTIPIHAQLHDILIETPESKRIGPVLPMLESWYTSKNGRPKVSTYISKIFKAAGIVTSVNVEGRKWKAPEATFHSLRHTFVSMSANAGVPLHIVQAIVGHESTAMTRHYYHENETALRQAVSAIPSIGEARNRKAIFAQNRLDSMAATGIEYFPEELETPGFDAPIVPQEAPKSLTAQLKEVETAKPEWQTMRPEDVKESFERTETAMQEPEVLPPEPKKIEIPADAKVEIREFGRVYVNGVATGGRVGGVQAKPRPPKTAWFGEVMRVWSKRRHVGILDGTLNLVSNGGHQFLQQLYARNTVNNPSEVCDYLEAYLKGRGIAMY